MPWLVYALLAGPLQLTMLVPIVFLIGMPLLSLIDSPLATSDNRVRLGLPEALVFLVVGAVLGCLSAGLSSRPFARLGGRWVWLLPTLFYATRLHLPIFGIPGYEGKSVVLYCYRGNIEFLMATLPAAAANGFSLAVAWYKWRGQKVFTRTLSWLDRRVFGQ